MADWRCCATDEGALASVVTHDMMYHTTWFCYCTVAGITHRPDMASDDAFLHRIRSVYAAAADASFDDSTDSLDSTGLSPDPAAATADAAADAAAMRHSVDVLPSTSNDPLYAPPDFLRPVSGPAVPPGCRTKFKYVSFRISLMSALSCRFFVSFSSHFSYSFLILSPITVYLWIFVFFT